ncbi:unnamed protein product [Absidia cylindrospora]
MNDVASSESPPPLPPKPKIPTYCPPSTSANLNQSPRPPPPQRQHKQPETPFLRFHDQHFSLPIHAGSAAHQHPHLYNPYSYQVPSSIQPPQMSPQQQHLNIHHMVSPHVSHAPFGQRMPYYQAPSSPMSFMDLNHLIIITRIHHISTAKTMSGISITPVYLRSTHISISINSINSIIKMRTVLPLQDTSSESPSQRN